VHCWNELLIERLDVGDAGRAVVGHGSRRQASNSASVRQRNAGGVTDTARVEPDEVENAR